MNPTSLQCPERCDDYGDHVDGGAVCGTDGKDYRDVCHMHKSACSMMTNIDVKYHGVCGK